MEQQQSKLTLEDKSKIVDLWKRKRQQNKHRKQRNFLRRFIFISLFLILNGGLLTYCYLAGTPDLSTAIRVEGTEANRLKSHLRIRPNPLWLFRVKNKDLELQIKENNPLIREVEFKPVIWPGEPRLEIEVEEDFPWARFSNGWLLASSKSGSQVRIIQDTESFSFDKWAFASSAVIMVDDNDYKFWSKQAKNLQKLIYAASVQFPETPLKGLSVSKTNSIILFFSGVQVNLGKLDEGLYERIAKLNSLHEPLKKYGKRLKELDLSNPSRAILKLNPETKKE